MLKYSVFGKTCCEKTFYCKDHTIREFGIIDSKNSQVKKNPSCYLAASKILATRYFNVAAR